MAQDMEYALAYAAYLALNQAPLSASPYATLGPSMMLYSTASSLVAKYYSLSAEVGEAGTITNVGMEKALINMLDLGMQNARESVALARRSGVDPVFSILYYEAARSLREGTAEEKLTALAYLWQATAHARLLASLSGGLREAPSPARRAPAAPRSQAR
jgi:hypothetical protein